MGTRVVMADQDKELVRSTLVRNFKKFGIPEETAVKAVTSGSVPMYMFVVRWICHNTDYPETRKLTKEHFFKGFYAWVHYKATVETLKATDFTETFEQGD